MQDGMVGTPPDAFASVRFSHPTQLEWFSVDMNRNSKGVPKGAQIRFGLL
jgi:hypothetical protein